MFNTLRTSIGTDASLKHLLLLWDRTVHFSRRKRPEMLYRAMRCAIGNRLEGDYLEFGSYRGDSLITAFHYGQRFGFTGRYKVFDSFSGLLRDDGVFHEGQYAATRAQFENRVSKAGVELSRVDVYEGWFQDVLPSLTLDSKAAVILIDCDVYDATKVALDFATRYLQRGTVLVFDDYFTNTALAQNQRTAFVESGISAESFGCFGHHGKAFIVTEV